VSTEVRVTRDLRVNATEPRDEVSSTTVASIAAGRRLLAVELKRRGPTLHASPRGLGRGRGVLVESRVEWLALLTPKEARDLARELLAAAGEAGSRRAVTAARDDQCRRTRRPSPSSLPHAGPAEELRP
jgi:hypothetical protein